MKRKEQEEKSKSIVREKTNHLISKVKIQINVERFAWNLKMKII